MAPFADSPNPLAAITLRGWDIFGETVPADVAGSVLALLADPLPLADALQSRPTTLIHGDLATVNMALSEGKLTLLDWAMPAAAPGAVDIARFVAGCSSVVDMSREQIIADYAEAAGSAFDETAMRLSLLGALCWLGWNKALDAAELLVLGVSERMIMGVMGWSNPAMINRYAHMIDPIRKDIAERWEACCGDPTTPSLRLTETKTETRARSALPDRTGEG